MSKESYARGFCKAAEAAGVDPVALAKYASNLKGNDAVLSSLGEPVSNPTQEHIDSLASLNPGAVAEATKGLTNGDYIQNMLKVDPRQARFWLGLANRNRPEVLKDKIDTSKFFGKNAPGIGENVLGSDPLTRRIMTGQYANVTNMAARAGLWDPVKHVPTLKGYGLVPSKK